ncbi:hypothetical protein Tco_0167143 [Tanacetum coccineum]
MLKRDLKSSMDTASESTVEKPSKPAAERSKIVISIQDKDGQKQFRVYTVLLNCWSRDCKKKQKQRNRLKTHENDSKPKCAYRVAQCMIKETVRNCKRTKELPHD